MRRVCGESGVYTSTLRRTQDSVFARGVTAPDSAASETPAPFGGAKIPLGRPLNAPHGEGDQRLCMGHNEFIVYEEDRVRFRYLLQLAF